MTTYWRGVLLDDRSAAMMNGVVALIPSATISPWQGSYSTSVSASFGTHAGGGAIDIGATRITDAMAHQIETAMRRVGWASWVRYPWQGPWDTHIHSVAVGCHDLSPAAATQVTNYFDGKNGLSGGALDTGDRTYVGVTWESYLAGGGAAGSPVPSSGGSAGSPGMPGPEWLTGAGTFLTPPTQDIDAELAALVAQFSPARTLD